MTFSPHVWCAAFLAMTLLDLAWVGYNRSTAQGRVRASMCWAAALAALGGVTTHAIAEGLVYTTATVCGALVGTGGGLRLSQWLEARRPAAREPITLVDVRFVPPVTFVRTHEGDRPS